MGFGHARLLFTTTTTNSTHHIAAAEMQSGSRRANELNSPNQRPDYGVPTSIRGGGRRKSKSSLVHWYMESSPPHGGRYHNLVMFGRGHDWAPDRSCMGETIGCHRSQSGR